MTALLLDTHVAQWLTAELDRLSAKASAAIDAADELAVVAITTPIAETAVAVPEIFLGDSADRRMCATAIEHGLQLVSKDRRLRAHPSPPAPGVVMASQCPAPLLRASIIEQAILDHLEEYEAACVDPNGESAQLRTG